MGRPFELQYAKEDSSCALQVIDDDEEEEEEDGSDAIEASEESSWRNTSTAKRSGQEVSTKDKGKGKAQRTITSLLPKLPLGEPQRIPSPHMCKGSLCTCTPMRKLRKVLTLHATCHAFVSRLAVAALTVTRQTGIHQTLKGLYTRENVQLYAGAPPPPPPPASEPVLRPEDEPMTCEEEDMDLLDFANTRVFGNPCFRSQQREVIKAVMAGRDVFVLMPTGGGDALKSLPMCSGFCGRALTMIAMLHDYL